MNRWLCTVVAIAATVLASACADSGVSPVEPDATARFSGGYSVGGNFADTTQVVQSSEGTTSSPGGVAVTDTTTDSRSGGYSVGGN